MNASFRPGPATDPVPTSDSHPDPRPADPAADGSDVGECPGGRLHRLRGTRILRGFSGLRSSPWWGLLLIGWLAGASADAALNPARLRT